MSHYHVIPLDRPVCQHLVQCSAFIYSADRFEAQFYQAFFL